MHRLAVKTFFTILAIFALLANNSQNCWMLHVALFAQPVACSCVLLGVVAQKFETGKTFIPVHTDAIQRARNPGRVCSFPKKENEERFTLKTIMINNERKGQLFLF